ncbi:MAG TPA: rRNA adenine N-6-methyltransferase family protein, partial [Candidatus Absconditabacterales bacterium]|nr:rRNA adenine N-6-methyltransferase family protein [Candidatus Absconditabacterales bacterium]
VIEKDETMKDHLEGILDKEQIIFVDVLKSNIEKELEKRNIDPKKTLVVGNLPYYITSPIFRKFFGNGEQKYFGGLFMIQEEVGQKIKTNNSPLGQKEGSGEISKHKKSFLRRLLNHTYNIEYKKTVGAKCFKPAPKVKSCLVQFQKKEKAIDLNFDKLFEFLDLYSQFSRKTLGAINKILQKQQKNTFPIPEDLKKKRLEELSWENIKKILK